MEDCFKRITNNKYLYRIYDEFDIYTCINIEREILNFLNKREQINELVIDLEGCTYMDSSGVASLIKIRKYLLNCEGDLYLKNLINQPEKVMRINRLNTFFKFVD